VRQIENFPTGEGDRPTSPILITSAGQLHLSRSDPSLTSTEVKPDGDPYEDYPDDNDPSMIDLDKPELALKAAGEIREIGNRLFKEGKSEEALGKYLSASLCSSCSVTRDSRAESMMV
jgi:peptidyl-prolyl isomerase D